MRQALHIFGKDVRQFWPQIVLVVMITAMFAYADIESWPTVPGAIDSAGIARVFPFGDNARPLIGPDADYGLDAVTFVASTAIARILSIFATRTVADVEGRHVAAHNQE